MASIKINLSYGIVIRRDAMHAHSITRAQVLEALEVDRPLAENDELLSFGPSFGQEASDEFVRRLESLGLIYFDDFFDLVLSHPDWLQFSARYAGAPRG